MRGRYSDDSGKAKDEQDDLHATEIHDSFDETMDEMKAEDFSYDSESSVLVRGFRQRRCRVATEDDVEVTVAQQP
jgi:hypothetical protein